MDTQEGECARLPVQKEIIPGPDCDEGNKSSKKKKKKKKKSKQSGSLTEESLVKASQEMICSIPEGGSLGNSKGRESTGNIPGCGSTDSTSGVSLAIISGKESSDTIPGGGILLDETSKDQSIGNVPGSEFTGNIPGGEFLGNVPGGGSSNSTQGERPTDGVSNGSSGIIPEKGSCDNTYKGGLLDDTSKGQSPGNVPGSVSTHSTSGGSSGGTPKRQSSSNSPGGKSADNTPRGEAIGSITRSGPLQHVPQTGFSNHTQEGQILGTTCRGGSTGNVSKGGLTDNTSENGSGGSTPESGSTGTVSKGGFTGSTPKGQSIASKHVLSQHKTEDTHSGEKNGKPGMEMEKQVTAPCSEKNGSSSENHSKSYVFVLHAYVDITHWMKNTSQFKEVEVRSSLNGWNWNVASAFKYR
jgi:hypothetical protein